jgi:hypothetical protein
MKKFYTLLVGIIFSFGINAQTVAITSGAGGAQGTSGNIIVGQSNYHVSESIYTETEIGGNTTFTSAGTAINKIGYYVTAVGSPATVSTFKIWMKNVPLATTTLAAGTYSTSGYTLVYNGSFTPTNVFPTPNELLLTTSFTRTAGTNLEVMVERLDGVLNTGYVFLSANGNQTSSTITTVRRYNGATAPTGASSLATSAFRPAIELIHVAPIDASAYDIIAPNVSCYGSLQNIGITIKNEGTTQIAAGAASVNFKIRGANSFTGTLTNTGAIAVGATGTVTFTGINLNNPGTNYDTAIVTITGDGDRSNDTLYTTTNTSPVLNTFPLVEDAETTPLPVFPYASRIDINQAWTLQSGAYSNPITTVDSLVPRAPGTRFYLFDSYNASDGTQSRLYSKCIDVPSPNAGLSVSFWMSHDSAYPAFQDSLYVSVSTDKGVNWTRLKGYSRLDETATAYYWKKDSVILNASYIGQTIQIGFEGISHYGNAFGLDDINVKLIPCVPVFNAVTQTACNSYTWTNGNGATYTTSGTYIYSYTGSGGCPVTDTLHLTINVGTITSTTQAACNSYTWNGTTYTASGNYAFLSGCNVDSLYLTINTGTFNSTTQSACNSYTWNGTTYTASGNYTYSYNNNNNCASVDTLHLTINTGTFNSTTQTACNSFTWNGTTYTVSGNYTYSYSNTNGCASVDTLHLTIIIGSQTTTRDTACNSYTWAVNNQTYTVSGNYAFAVGCVIDSLYLIINQSTHNVVTQAACNSYTWNGTTYTASGNYTYSYTNNSGCASVDTLHLTINTGTFNSTTQSACNSYTWNGTTYTASGNYTYSYNNNNTCASVDTLHLTITIGTQTTTRDTVCDSYTWHGTTYTTSGNYAFVNGCDVDSLYLIVNQSTHITTTASTTTSYTWNQTTYTASGVYTFSYNNNSGCASVDTLYLTINPAPHLVYNNPTKNGVFSINLSALQTVLLYKIFSVSVYDATGKLLFDQRLSNNGTNDINLSKYQNGIYFIIIHSSDNMIKYSDRILKAN